MAAAVGENTRWILFGLIAILSVLEATDFVRGESLHFIDTNFLYRNEDFYVNHCHTASGFTVCSQHVSLLHHRRKRADTGGNNTTIPAPTLPVATENPPAFTSPRQPSTVTAGNNASSSMATTEQQQRSSSPLPTATSTISTGKPTTTLKPTTPAPPTLSPWNFTVLEDKNHTYYVSQHFAAEKAKPYLIDINNIPNGKVKTHLVLSESHRTAGTVKLSFKFSFYGHEIEQVTIATGGFLYMSSFLHQWLTATQYIAPLMANFDTRIGDSSHIKYVDNGTLFVVQWENVHLKDLAPVGSFNFQAALFKSGKIIFSYIKVPYAIQNIPVGQHPVKVGVSDAFYNDTDHYVPQGRRRTRLIREYHRVALSYKYIVSGAVYVLNPVETCLMQKDCSTCLTKSLSFSCSWCSALEHCSDGMDRKRQLWFKKGCAKQNNKTCPANMIGVVVGIFIIVFVVCIVVGWVWYAYRNPTSRSGMWLMEHRPSQLKMKMKFWKRGDSGGEKYQVSVEPSGTESVA
ncbi:plexin domain-containing protein 1-like [Tubulanus polymorphus]|uniref:plexin domain-containing protein 1-like n=1 Tax=Tubulanus polymorphus TaxID=672921 RepID=UPI003DA27A2C